MIATDSRTHVRLFRSERAIPDRADAAGRVLACSALALSLIAHWAMISTSHTGGSLALGAATALKTSIQIARPAKPDEPLPPATPQTTPHPDTVEIANAKPPIQPLSATVSNTSPRLDPVKITEQTPPEPQPMAPTVPVAPPRLEPVNLTETKPAPPQFRPQAKPAEPPRPESIAERAPQEPEIPVEQPVAETPVEPTPRETQSETMKTAAAEQASPKPARATATASGGAPAAEPILVTKPQFRIPPRPPTYPPVARRRNEEGVVVLRALVSPGGSTQRIEIWRSSGFYRLDDAARTAVEGWNFEPARKAGLAVASWVQVPIRFQLD